MEKEIIDLLIRSADASISELNSRGYLLGGKNGPYNDNETPYRVCAHWVFIYDYLYKMTQEKKYLKAIEKIGDYLYKEYLKNEKTVFKCRQKEGKDCVNGTIGNAWIIEGFIRLATVLNIQKFYDAAVELFLSFPFDKQIGIWDRREYDGKLLGYDGTFNHQLWLAAAGSQIIHYRDNKSIREQINVFLKKCSSNFLLNIYKDGLIKHFLYVKKSNKDILRFYYNNLKNDLNVLLHKPNMRYKEEGYHFFSVYGFALLYEEFSEHSFFKTKKFKRILDYTFNKQSYLKLVKQDRQMDITGLASKYIIDSNIYSFAYNSPFFELPYIYLTFKKDVMPNVEFYNLWEIQKKITVSDNSICKDSNDVITLTARLYELVRYLEKRDILMEVKNEYEK